MNFVLTGFVGVFHSETVGETYLTFHHGLSDVDRGLSLATFGDNSDSLPLADPNSIGV